MAAPLLGILLCVANASDGQGFPFVDGIWSGGVESGSASGASEVCWARTSFKDSTNLTLSVRSDKNWELRLSNLGWALPPSHRYDLVALVDFYPQLHVVAQSTGPKILEFANIERNSLLGLIENGHTITLSSDEFNAKYDLEGSAKVIARLRGCFQN